MKLYCDICGKFVCRVNEVIHHGCICADCWGVEEE